MAAIRFPKFLSQLVLQFRRSLLGEAASRPTYIQGAIHLPVSAPPTPSPLLYELVRDGTSSVLLYATGYQHHLARA